jgi:hypothetical protein
VPADESEVNWSTRVNWVLCQPERVESIGLSVIVVTVVTVMTVKKVVILSGNRSGDRPLNLILLLSVFRNI